MKILTLISGGDVGGAKTHVLSLLAALSRRIGVTMVCFMESEFTEDARKMGIDTRIMPGNNLPATAKRLSALISQEGFDIIQEAVNAAADLETERIMQRLTWISVCSNLAPSLGLLGTVQGMILCFATLASGVPDIGALAGTISQALWTTAGGLVVSIPSLTIFYSIRNNANRLILRMTALTMELIKPLRNVEVEPGA